MLCAAFASEPRCALQTAHEVAGHTTYAVDIRLVWAMDIIQRDAIVEFLLFLVGEVSEPIPCTRFKSRITLEASCGCGFY